MANVEYMYELNKYFKQEESAILERLGFKLVHPTIKDNIGVELLVSAPHYTYKYDGGDRMHVLSHPTMPKKRFQLVFTKDGVDDGMYVVYYQNYPTKNFKSFNDLINYIEENA